MAKEVPQYSSNPQVVHKFRVYFGQDMGSGKQESSLGVES